MAKTEKVIEDGIEYTVRTSIYDNVKYWRLNGKWHRIGGPAVEWDAGNNWWYLDGKRYTYKDYIKEIYKRFGAGQVMLLRAKYG
jgi:hypothetical protein